MTDRQTTEGFWDRAAGAYDAEHDRENSTQNPLWIRMAVVLRLLGPSPGSVIDCGMGPGRLLLELDQRGWTIAGIDVSREMVALARLRLPGSSSRLVHGTVESLPFPSESYDAAVATGVFEYVKDVPGALAEVRRVLRPGGLFVIGAPNASALHTFCRHRVVYPLVRALKSRLRVGRPVPLPRPGLLSRRHLEAQLAYAGLKVERVEYIVLMPGPLRLLSSSLCVRVAGRLESPPLGRLLGGQFVVVARKPSSTNDR